MLASIFFEDAIRSLQGILSVKLSGIRGDEKAKRLLKERDDVDKRQK